MSFTRNSSRNLVRALSHSCPSIRASAKPFALLALRSWQTRSLSSYRTPLVIGHKNSSSSSLFVRSYSVIEEESSAPVIDFTKMKAIVSKKDPAVVIVDVREPDEYKAGHVPGAINIPCKSSPGAYGLSPEEFKLTFNFEKPSTDKTLVFYCLGGIRSSISEELAGTCDYSKRLNYKGSWTDWVANKGEVEKNEEKAEPKAEKSEKAEKAEKPAPEADKSEPEKK